MTSAYRDVPEALAIPLALSRDHVCRSRCVTSRFRSTNFLHRRHGVTQLSEDKIVGVVKINIRVPCARPVASILFSLGSFFFFFFIPSFSRHVRKSACEQKQTEIGPLRAPLATKRVFCSRLPIAYTLLPRGNDFRVRVRPTHSSRFLSSRTVPPPSRRPRNRVELPSILRYFHPSARFIPHSELSDADDRCIRSAPSKNVI